MRHLRRISLGGANRAIVILGVAVAGIAADAPGLISGDQSGAQAQSIDQIIRQLTGGGPGRSLRRRSVNRDMPVPPLPVKQPKPWRTEMYASETRPYPSTGPEREWPRLVRSSQGGAETPPPSGSPQRPPVASPRRAANIAPRPQSSRSAAAAAGAGSAGAPSAVPPPDVYTASEVNLAKARCRRLLSQVNAVVEPEAPIKKGPCGDPAPVKLIALGRAPQVKVMPPAIVNCDMVVALAGWLKDDLQPLARKYLESPIIRLENMSSYSCRNAYGRKHTKLSEHAKANALDIRGFVTAKGRAARVLASWGPTQRDITAFQIAKAEADRRQELAKDQTLAREKSLAQQAPPPMRRATIVDGVGGADGAEPPQSGVPALSMVPSRLGGPVPVPGKRATSAAKAGLPLIKVKAVDEPQPSTTPAALFLKTAHTTACERFGTTLGPEANEAHRNHFHVDLAERKYRNYCR